MIKSYKGKLIEQLFNHKSNFPEHIKQKAFMRLNQIDFAKEIRDMEKPYSNQLKKLSGDRKNQYSIRINNQWRICFKFENENAYDVEMVDYH